MIVLLPPSETKRDGGSERVLRLETLSFGGLTSSRRKAITALRALSRSVSGSMSALGLGVTQRAEIDRNRTLTTSPVMPAMDRYTGVLYDALEAESLSEGERRFAATHVVIGSALFGLLGAGDEIPAYRLSHNTSLPGLSLRRHWKDVIAAELDRDGLILDLRSESYAHLGTAPGVVYVRVVSEGADGRRKALSHFNKAAKGRFTRALIQAGIVHADTESLVTWAESAGIRLERTAEGLDLIV